MKKSTFVPPSAGMRTWLEIGQRTPGRPLSLVARRKQIVRWLGVGATLFLVGAMAWLAIWAVKIYHQSPQSQQAVAPGAPLQRVDFASDGVLTEDWARQYLALQNGKALMQYDVFALQQHLLDTKQVLKASVERVLPETLRIRITERRPWLRIAADDSKGGYKTWLVARDGQVFDGQLFSDERLRILPWLVGVTLHPVRNGYDLLQNPDSVKNGSEALANDSKNVAQGVDAAATLLTQALSLVPQLEQQWTVVDLSAFDGRPQSPLSLLKIRTRDQVELVFLAENYGTQLDRLAFTMHSLQEKQVQPKRIDLSIVDSDKKNQFSNQVVVQLAALPATSATAKRIH